MLFSMAGDLKIMVNAFAIVVEILTEQNKQDTTTLIKAVMCEKEDSSGFQMRKII